MCSVFVSMLHQHECMYFEHERTYNDSDMLQKHVSTCIVSCACSITSCRVHAALACMLMRRVVSCAVSCVVEGCAVAWRGVMPCHAMPCRSMLMPCRVVARRTVLVPSRAVPCCAMPCAAVRCHAMPCPPCRAMTCPCRAMTCRCVPYQTVKRHAEQSHAILRQAVHALLHHAMCEGKNH